MTKWCLGDEMGTPEVYRLVPARAEFSAARSRPEPTCKPELLAVQEF